MPDDLYRSDILAWSSTQSERLRRVAAGERVNDVDWPNVIEEIESVGRSELKAVRSFLFRALEHALKIIAWPGHPATRSWHEEIETFLMQARFRYEPGMAQHLGLEEVQMRARRAVLRARMDSASAPLPSPVTLEADFLLDEETGPDELVTCLAQPGPG